MSTSGARPHYFSAHPPRVRVHPHKNTAAPAAPKTPRGCCGCGGLSFGCGCPPHPRECETEAAKPYLALQHLIGYRSCHAWRVRCSGNSTPRDSSLELDHSGNLVQGVGTLSASPGPRGAHTRFPRLPRDPRPPRGTEARPAPCLGERLRSLWCPNTPSVERVWSETERAS